MTSLRLFLHGCLIQYKALFQWATPLGYLSSKILMPVFQVIFFVQLGVFATGHANALYFAVGNAIQVTAVNGIFGVVMTVGNERQFGTLPLLLASPANRLATFLGRALMHILDGISSVVVGFVVAALLYGLDLGRADLPLLALSIALTSATVCGLGLMLGSLSLIYRDVMLIGNLVYYLLLIFAGVNFPVHRLPPALQLISYGIPMTRGVEAARLAVQGSPIGPAAGLLAGEAAIGLAYAGVGYLLFLWLERMARRGGLQEAY